MDSSTGKSRFDSSLEPNITTQEKIWAESEGIDTTSNGHRTVAIDSTNDNKLEGTKAPSHVHTTPGELDHSAKPHVSLGRFFNSCWCSC